MDRSTAGFFAVPPTLPHRWLHGSLLCWALMGCGTEPDSPTPAPASSAEVAAPAVFDVHEWGLIAVGVGHTRWSAPSPDALRPELRRIGVGGLGLTGPGAAGGKPVLYVHLGEGVERARFQAQVRVTGGTIPEHFPPAEALPPESPAEPGTTTGQGVAWREVIAQRGACRGTYPQVGTHECRTAPDHYCERAELSRYETDDAACLHVGDQRVGLLFYRGAGGRSALPLQVTPEGNAFRVSNAGRATGPMFVVLRGARRGDSRVSALEVPAPGESVVVQRPGPLSASPVTDARLAQLVQPMAEAGLTRAEVAAFRRAWDDALFAPPEGVGAPGGPWAQIAPVHPLAPTRVALLYWLPASDIAAAFPLEITPAPRTTRRMVLVRVDLDPAAQTTRSPRPRVRPGTPSVEGPLSVNVIGRIVRVHRREVEDCAERDPGDYTLELDLRLAPDGRVASSTVTTPDIPPRLGTCIARRARRWRFPTAEGVTSVRYPFVISQPTEQ